MTDLIPRPFEPPSDLSIRDFKADRIAGKATLYFDAANAAAQMICGLYGKSPSTVVKLIPAGAGLIDNSRGLFDDLCQNIAPLPPPPALPFSGGQCDSVSYDVTVRINHYIGGDSTSGPLTRVDIYSTQVWGPVSTDFLTAPATWTNGNVSGAGFGKVTMVCRGTTNLAVQPSGSFDVIGDSSNSFISIQSVSIVRSNGQPDLCGNPLPQYPPPSATVNDFSSTAVLHINPTTTINAPITFTPTIAPSVGLFRPEFNFNVGGINVNLSIGGFTFSPTLEIPVNLPVPYFDPRSAPGVPRPINPPSNGSGSTPFDPTAIITRLHRIEQEIIDCCAAFHPYSPPPLANIIATSLGSGQGGTFALPPLTFRVDVQITTRPTREKVQIGVLSPDVLFAGWARFSDGATTGKRQAIDSVKTFFSPTERIANTFTYTLYTGYVANVIAFSVAAIPPAP